MFSSSITNSIRSYRRLIYWFTVHGPASAGAQAIGQRQQAKQQAAYQAQAAQAERLRFQQEQTSMRMRQAQEQEAVGRELEQVSHKSQAALARARVSAGEAGVAGASVQALMDDYMRQEAGYRGALLRQQELGGIATGMGLEQAGFASMQRQIGINQPISSPSGFSSALSIASGALSGYSAGMQAGSGLGGGGGFGGPSTTTSAPSSTVLQRNIQHNG